MLESRSTGVLEYWGIGVRGRFLHDVYNVEWEIRQSEVGGFYIMFIMQNGNIGSQTWDVFTLC